MKLDDLIKTNAFLYLSFTERLKWKIGLRNTTKRKNKVSPEY